MSETSTENALKTSKQNIARTAIGVSLIATAFILFISFSSFLLNWKNDQSQLERLTNKTELANNVFGKAGAWLGDIFMYNFIGVSSFLIPTFLLLFGVKLLFKIKTIKLLSTLFNVLFFMIWIPIFIGLFWRNQLLLQGLIGFEVNDYLNSFIGALGIGILLFMSLLLYLILEWKLTPERFKRELKLDSKDLDTEESFVLSQETENQPIESESNHNDEVHIETQTKEDVLEEEPQKDEPYLKTEASQNIPLDIESNTEKIESEPIDSGSQSFVVTNTTLTKEPVVSDLDLQVAKPTTEVQTEENSANKKVEEFGEYDPTLELSNYQFPTLELLKSYDAEGQVTIDQKELEANKNRIVETLGNYGIKIAQIKATIGPTVTLYEIVPEAGVRISKIKNLEDDIALSLSALGIRIIAPIPGKGTIGIEVPNTHTSIVSMHSVIASKKFQENKKMALPIAFGKTISNETFVADLAKMPHLLMAGATGQGKSVGLNAIITSLLYKKHPAELKFVFVDPKKVELTLYNKIERHFLAKLPDSDEPIITDNSKVINTLNSLCIEMDDRYELLKNAYVRNIKEYNEKFKQRKLNPEKGHRFLPYIVLVVDEFADLIMTAGKEVELPIARLAQLARAIGIHLIIATQRPSVNVITGMIKANFPARVAFRVTSKIDSRTILDSGGADQLIGKGDMLFTTGNDLVRLQCAFVDTPEVEEITEYIGGQKGYANAFLLPEYVGEEGSKPDVDLNERDALFEDAARVLVIAQQGSASLLQRKLKLGYNRAGRLIDQLEAAGVVGPFEGSKARQVLVPDEMSLEQLLDNLNG